MRAAVTFTPLPVAYFLGILFKSSGFNYLLALFADFGTDAFPLFDPVTLLL
jgi:hypothetical protein